MNPVPCCTFTLPSGRVIRLTHLYLSPTYEGAFEENPDILAPLIAGQAQNAVQRILPPGKPLLVLRGEGKPLPAYRWIARLQSTSCLKTKTPGFNSRLYLCWFSEAIYADFQNDIQPLVESIDWEKSASDYEIMP